MKCQSDASLLCSSQFYLKLFLLDSETTEDESEEPTETKEDEANVENQVVHTGTNISTTHFPNSEHCVLNFLTTQVYHNMHRHQ